MHDAVPGDQLQRPGRGHRCCSSDRRPREGGSAPEHHRHVDSAADGAEAEKRRINVGLATADGEEMVYLESGTLCLVEYQEQLEPGSLVGEIGLFAPDNRRTMTIECATNCTLYSLTAEGMAQLYYMNPKLGYHVMRLVVARLMRDAERTR